MKTIIITNGVKETAAMNGDDSSVPAGDGDATAPQVHDMTAVNHDSEELPQTPKHRTTQYVMQGDEEEEKTANHPTTPSAAPGELDKFFNYSTSAVTIIQAPTHVPSPSSTLSWSASPDFVAGFPETSGSDRKARRQRHPVTTGNEHQVLKIFIESTPENHQTATNGSFFFVPVSLMLQREIEMQEAARHHRIGQDRWSSSRIFRLWKTMQRHKPDHGGEIMTLRLTPEVSPGETQLQDVSTNEVSRFRWKPWLTVCIRAYYNTGVLRIPQACQGDDILLALEYFGILTANMDMFVFESSEAFERVKAWSRYFSYRTELAEELLEAFDNIDEEKDANEGESCEDMEIDADQAKHLFLKTSSHAHMWVLVAEETGGFPTVGSAGDDVRSMLRVDGVEASALPVGAEGGLYDLFCNSDAHTAEMNGNENIQPVSERLRQDFARYVQQSLPPHLTVTFKMSKVERAPSSISTVRDEDAASNASFKMKPVIVIGPDGERLEQDSLNPKSMDKMTDPDPSTPIESTLPVKGMVDDADGATKDTSALDDDSRWKISTEDHDCHHSLHTKTLAGEGISPKMTPDGSFGPSPLAKKVLFLDEHLHEQPELEGDSGGGCAKMGYQIKPRMNVDCPISPRSLLVEHCVNDWINKYQTDDKRSERNKSIRDQAPVSYVNTEFGDLQSVTSMLTDPVLDSSENAYLMSVLNSDHAAHTAKCNHEVVSREEEKRLVAEAAKRIIQRRLLDSGGGQKPSTTDLPEGTVSPEGVLEESKEMAMHQNEGVLASVPYISEDTALRDPSPGLVKTDASSQESRPEVTTVVESNELIAASHERKVVQVAAATANKDPWTELGLLLSGLCEAVIPSHSVQAPHATDPRSLDAEQREASSSSPSDRPFGGCPCRQDPDTILMDSETSNWVPPTIVDGPKIEKDINVTTADDMLNPDKLLEGAKQLGRDISIQFDALLKMAMEGSDEVKEIVSGAMAPIPEDGPSAILDLEKPVEITTKKHKQMTADSYAIPKSQSFDSDPLADTLVPLPPHHPRRFKNKIAVARKKNKPKLTMEMQPPAPTSDAPIAPLQRQQRCSTSTKDASVSSLSQSTFTKQTDTRTMLL